MAGWTDLKELLKFEEIEAREAGYDLSGFVLPDTDDEAELNKAYDQLMALSMRTDYPYVEPDALDAIRADSEDIPAKQISEEKLLKHLHAAWVGRAAGCALGKPVECGPYMAGTPGTPGWKNVKAWFEGADAYPIDFYTPAHSRAEEQGLFVGCPLSHRENITYMESDDDVRYTVLGLRILEQNGLHFSTWDVGKAWHNNLTYAQVCTAETQAYLNFAHMTSHMKGNAPADVEKALEFTRTYRNPYREWIGAQIRVDAYGYAAAGDPVLAAEMAYNDSRLSHIKNGVYGAMFCAAMIAAAFTAESPEEIVTTAMKVVPKKSRLYEALTDTLTWAKPGMDPEEACRILWEKWGAYDGVHTINNAAACAAMVLIADGDYEKAITSAVLCGWDTDCNGATVGSIMGAYLGEIPEKWTAPLHDTMYSSVVGFDPILFKDAAARTLDVVKKNRPEALA